MGANNRQDRAYNYSAKYEVVGRVPDGTSVVAYICLDRENGKHTMLSKGIVEQLALNKNIYNVQAQIYNNIVNLKGINCKLSQLPRYNANGSIIENNTVSNKKDIVPFIRIIGRVQKSKSISGYIVEYKTKDNKTARKKIDKEMMLGLARKGYVINAKAQLNNGVLMLRGLNEDLGMLKTYKEN